MPLRIIRIDADRHRLGLSLRQAQEDETETIPSVYTTAGPSGATLGDMATGLQDLPTREVTAAEPEGVPPASPPVFVEGEGSGAPAATEASTAPSGDVGPNPPLAPVQA